MTLGTLYLDSVITRFLSYKTPSPYHVGQIVYLGKILKQENWQSLSIPVGGSEQYNNEMFNR